MRTFAPMQNQHSKPGLSSLARSRTAAPGVHHPADLLLHLQRTIGNQAVQRLVRLQTRNSFNSASASTQTLAALPEAPPVVDEVVNSPGQPLEQDTRAFFETRFGYDLRGIEVHADSKAAASAQSVNALAYTVGRHIVFNHAQYAPRTDAGLRLLAHELAHTIQQSDHTARSALGSPGDVAEHSAEIAAHNVMRGRDIPPLGRTPVGLARQPLPKNSPDVSAKPRESDTVLYFNLSEVWQRLKGIRLPQNVMWRRLGAGTRSPEGIMTELVHPLNFVDWMAMNAQAGFDKEQLEERILKSPEFIGSAKIRQDWAGILHRFISQEAFMKLGESEEAKEFRARSYEKPVRIEHGLVHAKYSPEQETLTVSVPIQLDFVDSFSEKTRFEGDPRGDKPVKLITEKVEERWSGTEKEDYRREFIALVQDTWSSAKTQHTIYCHKPGWTALKAQVIVKVQEIGNITRGSGYYAVKVYRGESPEGKCGPGSPAGRECVYGTGQPRAVLTYSDIRPSPYLEGGASIAAHEFGHMLGLGDEYEHGRESDPEEASHSYLVRGEFGYEVPKLDFATRRDRFRESIMSGGGKVLPEHGVIFLKMMTEITGVGEWHLWRLHSKGR